MHPLRLQYEVFGPSNPVMSSVKQRPRPSAKRAIRRRPTIPFLALQENMSRQIVDGLEAWRRMVEHVSEQTFHAVYGAPALQAALGIDTKSARPPRKAAKNLLHRALLRTGSQD